MTEFSIDNKLDKASCLKLAKIAQHLELLGNTHLHIEYAQYGEGFQAEILCIDEKPASEDIPFRGGKTLAEFLDEFHGPFISQNLEYQETDDSQRFHLHLKAGEVNQTGKRKWRVSYDYDETINNEEISTHHSDAQSHEGDPAFNAIVAFLKEHNCESMTYYFSGGGDEGDLNELEIDVPMDIREQTNIVLEGASDPVSFSTLAYDYCQSEATQVGNWWDNEGGCGNIEISVEGDQIITVSYDNYEMEEVLSDVSIETEIDILSTMQGPQKQSGLELS